MATSVVRNFLFQAPGPRYVPLVPHQHHQHTPSAQGFLEKTEETQDEREKREEDEAEPGEEMEMEDDDVDCESEVQEEESECLDTAVLSPPQPTVDMTRQLLRFADLISNDVQRYFGRGAGAQDSGEGHSDDSLPVTSSGQLRYYDDLLKIARTGSPDDREATGSARGEGEARGASGLGPLAELFDQSRLTQGCSRPMVKRHLPLSFWTEPTPRRSESTDADESTSSQGSAHTDLHTQEHYPAHSHAETHALENAHPDFSDLLAHWDPNPELPHTL